MAFDVDAGRLASGVARAAPVPIGLERRLDARCGEVFAAAKRGTKRLIPLVD